MPKPFTMPRSRRRMPSTYGGSTVFRMFLISSIYFGWIVHHGWVLRHDLTPLGILSLQQANTAEKFRGVVEAWSVLNLRGVAIQNLYWDYGFIAFYAGALSLLYVWAAKRMPDSRSRLREFLLASAWLQWIAGLCDAAENTLHVTMLKGQLAIDDPWPLAAVCFTIAKFVLIAICLPLLIWTGACIFRDRLPNKAGQL